MDYIGLLAVVGVVMVVIGAAVIVFSWQDRFVDEAAPLAFAILGGAITAVGLACLFPPLVTLVFGDTA